MKKEITIGSLIRLKPPTKLESTTTDWSKKRHMGAETGAVAIAVSDPYISTWSKRKVIEVLWVDEKAHNQSNGGYFVSEFAPITAEQREAIVHGKKSERYSIPLHIDSLAHWFSMVGSGIKPLHTK